MIASPERVQVYIDGFNLYFGMTTRMKNTKWLNVYALAENLLKPGQVLVGVKYYTSRVSNSPAKEKRQRTYLDAIGTTHTKIIYGHYLSEAIKCNRCGHSWNGNEEKMTDVNIAVNMIMDVVEDKYDTALLISGDSDLVPPINSIHEKFPNKKIIVAFPPDRYTASMKNAAKGSFVIGKANLMKSQFPSAITTSTGYVLIKPTEWI